MKIPRRNVLLIEILLCWGLTAHFVAFAFLLLPHHLWILLEHDALFVVPTLLYEVGGLAGVLCVWALYLKTVRSPASWFPSFGVRVGSIAATLVLVFLPLGTPVTEFVQDFEPGALIFLFVGSVMPLACLWHLLYLERSL